MVKTIYICDHCKKEVNDESGIKEIEIPVIFAVNHTVKTKKMELCFKCLKELFDINKKFIGEE